VVSCAFFATANSLEYNGTAIYSVSNGHERT